MNVDPDKGKLSVDIKLTEQWVLEGDTQSYDMQVKYSIISREGGVLWSLNLDYPYPIVRTPNLFLNPYRHYFVLKMNGSHLNNAGRITMEMKSRANSYDAEMNYELDENSLVTDFAVSDARGKETTLALDMADGKLDRFSLSYGYSREYALRMLTNSRLTEPLFSVESDGKQVIIVQDGVTIRCTGEFESDREYLMTMTPEGKDLGETGPAYIRLAYDGEEGDWTLHAAVIDPEGSEYASAMLAIRHADSVERLSDAKELMMLTPELAEQLIDMMMSN